MTNDEKKAKALEEETKFHSSEELTPEKEEDIISNDDAEKLEGGVSTDPNGDELIQPSGGIFGTSTCCNL